MPRPTLPTPPLADVLALVPAALGLFLVSFADEILTARAFAGKRGEHVRASQELLTMGAANAAAGFTQGFSIGASGARTAVNDAVGARTQIAGLFSAGAIVVILLFLTEPVQYLPQAVLGAVIVAAGINIVEPAAWRALAAIDRVEVAIAAVTTGCVVFFGVLEALVVAVGLSIIDTVRRSARPYDAVLGWVPHLEGYRDVALHPSAQVTPGVVVYRLDDRLFFANAQYVKGRVREAIRAAPTETSWFVFDAEAVNHIDSTGIDALLDLTRELQRGADHARRRETPDAHAAGLRGGRPHRRDRAGALLSVGEARSRRSPPLDAGGAQGRMKRFSGRRFGTVVVAVALALFARSVSEYVPGGTPSGNLKVRLNDRVLPAGSRIGYENDSSSPLSPASV